VVVFFVRVRGGAAASPQRRPYPLAQRRQALITDRAVTAKP
jgi:hypothetical protein